MRVLAGFAVHSNVGALLLVDQGTEILTTQVCLCAGGAAPSLTRSPPPSPVLVRAQRLVGYMHAHDYPLESVPHETLSLSAGSAEENLTRGENIVRALLARAAAAERQPSSLEHLTFAQQCGGSDAFSGISANPLAG